MKTHPTHSTHSTYLTHVTHLTRPTYLPYPTHQTYPTHLTYSDLPDRRILDPELLQVILVLRPIVVVLLHRRPVLRHDLLVQPDRRLVFGPNQRNLFRVLR